MRKFITIFLSLVFPAFSSISVYFTPSEKAEKNIIEKIKNARKSVLIASYKFNHPEIIKILKNKYLKELKIIVEKRNLPFSKKNIHFYKGTGIFHSKFIVIDGKITIVGSGNFTESDFHLSHNNFLIIEDREVGEFFKRKFLSVWNNEENNEIFKNGKIEIYFSPENNVEKKIIEEIKKAKSYIYFACFFLTSENIAKALIKQKIKGIEEKGIFENYNTSKNSTFYILRDFGINVRKSNMAGFLHDKLFLIDGKTVITGSYNPTVSAKKNSETVIILREERIAETYKKEWEKLWRWKCLP